MIYLILALATAWTAAALWLRHYCKQWETLHAGTPEMEPRHVRAARHGYLLLLEPVCIAKRVWPHLCGIVREMIRY